VSGTQSANTVEGGIGFSELGLNINAGSSLLRLLTAEDIVPGSNASYQLCKDLYVYHPLGAKMAEAPINMAQSQEREITVPGGPEERLVEAFKKEWKATGASVGANVAIGADVIIHNVMRTARIYGIASLAVVEKGGDASKPFGLNSDQSLQYNVLDPLNTAGSLVLNQDPNSPDFQKPIAIRAGNKVYHPSRTVVLMNEQPIYIEFTPSAFGFVGRSVYQRALYPMRTFVQSMITDQYVTLKVGLLIAKMKMPGPVVNNRILNFFGIKRSALKAGMTGNVLNIGIEDSIESLNFQNLEGPAKFARDNCLQNIAMAANMPAKLLQQEEMIGGMAEGTEDAKQIARYIDRVRVEMAPLYTFFDRIVMRKAWSKEFYKSLQNDGIVPKNVPYETAFYQWSNAFTATWPNLLAEPESKEIEVEKTRFESVVALVESMVNAGLDPENKAAVLAWAADEVNSRRRLFSAPLHIDEDALAAYVPPTPMGGEGEGSEKEQEPPAFSPRT
jgi:Anti-CBASS Acb1-like protein